MNTQELTELTERLHSTGYKRREIEETISDLMTLDPRKDALADPGKNDWIVSLTRAETEELFNLRVEEIRIAIRRLEVKDRALCREFHRLAAQLAEALKGGR